MMDRGYGFVCGVNHPGMTCGEYNDRKCVCGHTWGEHSSGNDGPCVKCNTCDSFNAVPGIDNGR